ncbi:MAG: PIN domain nuclease [Chloroflexota bacterium]|nr:PIN domain nuclease [Chloroflexota bacterium]MDE2942385.1 PIN domain nuclease [Chloroflexota bacterium]MDE3267935.1 PIN domain nuclease [Chloroflexota bacterium]
MVNHWWYRLAIAPLAGLGGWWLGILAGSLTNSELSTLWGAIGAATGAFIGILIAPYLVPALLLPFAPLGRSVSSIPFSTLVSGTAGLVLGLTIAALVSVAFSRLPGWPGVAVPMALTAVFGVAGLAVGVARERDVSQLLPERARRGEALGRGSPNGRVLMDTSAIIDGRIADISKTGFVHGAMVIPRFILDELQHVADSSDSLKRARGRRGLEMLNKLRKEAEVPIQIMDVDYRDGSEVDGKLVRLAKNLNAQIMTTDFNLNRVAELQGVRVLNVNELANALKPVVLPGEEMMVRIIQEGKEYGQGVGFLDDGTMVVVEGGRKHINTHLDVSITRVLQTAAGRIIFAQPQVG